MQYFRDVREVSGRYNIEPTWCVSDNYCISDSCRIYIQLVDRIYSAYIHKLNQEYSFSLWMGIFSESILYVGMLYIYLVYTYICYISEQRISTFLLFTIYFIFKVHTHNTAAIYVLIKLMLNTKPYIPWCSYDIKLVYSYLAI